MYDNKQQKKIQTKTWTPTSTCTCNFWAKPFNFHIDCHLISPYNTWIQDILWQDGDKKKQM